MISCQRLAPAILLSFALLAAGCATPPSPIQKAESSIDAGRYEEGLGALETLAGKEKGTESKDAHEALLRNRAIVADRISREAKNALYAERLDDADALYIRLLTIDPNNVQAKIDRQRLHDTRKRSAQLTKADELFRSGDLAGSEQKLQSVLLEEPANSKALELVRKIADRQAKNSSLMPALGPEFKKTISLEFRDASLKDVFDAIWHASGINFILDRDVRSDLKVSIFVHDITIEEAIDGLLMTQQMAKKIVNAKTLFIYPKTPQKVAEYQELTVRNFFLAYADTKQIQSMLKTILKAKDVYIDEKRNLLVIRDTQEIVDMAEKLIRAHDQPEPEVMLALDVVEITRSTLKDLGITFPTQIGIGISNPITAQALSHLNSTGINIGFGGLSGTAGTTGTAGTGLIGTVNLTDSISTANLLANPRIRVRNREKAKIHIGDRLPVVTTTASSTSTFVGQTVNYLDVGLMLEVEPQVMLDNDVVVKLNLEVSTATQDKLNVGFYDVGTRNTTTVLTIHDGETQILAGLIQDNETNTGNNLPGFSDIPLLGRLFSDHSKQRDKTEIFLAITPRVINNLVRPSAELTEYASGSETGQQGTISAGQPFVPSIMPQQVKPAVSAVPIGGFPVPPSASAPGSNAAPGVNPALGSAAPAPSTTGVIPLSDFSPPPGAGSPAPVPVAAPAVP